MKGNSPSVVLWLTAVAVLALGSATLRAESPFYLFRDGKPTAALVLVSVPPVPDGVRQDPVSRVVVPDDVRPDIIRALDEFRRDISIAWDIDLPLRSADDPDPEPVETLQGRIEIVVEPRDPMSEDETRVSFPSPEVMRITGGESGVIRTLFYLLEEFGGVRYLFQGERNHADIGAHFPTLTELAVPRRAFTRSSAFPLDRRSSQTSMGTHWPDAQNRAYFWAWEGRLGTKARLANGIDLADIAFPFERYRDPAQRPDETVFPIVDGRRLLPWEHDLRPNSGWQPRYHSQAAVDEAVANLLDHLRAHPETPTLSLTANMGGGFCDTMTTSPSEAYYGWVNAVAASVSAEFPGVRFGLNAYREVLEPPSFPLHSNVVAYLTFGFEATRDPVVREQRTDLIRRWSKVAAIGSYCHNLSAPTYSLPRWFVAENQHMVQVFRDHGAVAAFTERPYDTALEGPRMYLYFKLLENPDLDVEAAIQDWCDAAVGEVAGIHLQAYYRFWEAFWRDKAVHTPWWGSRHGIYLTPGQFGSYMAAAEPGDMEHCRDLMERVVALAGDHGDAAQQRRARLLFRYFEWFEAAVIASGAPYFAVDGTLPDAAAAKALIRNLPRAVEARERFVTLPETIPEWLVPNMATSRMNADPVVNSLSAVGPWLRDAGVVAALKPLAGDAGLDPQLRFFCGMLYRRGRGQPLANLIDGDFAAGDHGWALTHSVHGEISRIQDIAATGSHALKCDIRHRNFTLERIVADVEPFVEHYFSARVFVPEGQDRGEGVLNIRGSPAVVSAGRVMNRGHTRNIPDHVLPPGRWHEVACIVPAARVATDHLRLRLVFKNFPPRTVAYVDDLIVLPIPTL